MQKSNYTIRKAKPSDLHTIATLVGAARQIMRDSGNPTQWSDGYPSIEILENDISSETCFLVIDGETPVGSFVLKNGPDPSYAEIHQGNWTDDNRPYMVIHRITSLPEAHGVFASAIGFCKSQCRNIRIDTHKDNLIIQHLLDKHGFRYCGIITLADGGGERLAYQWLRD